MTSLNIKQQLLSLLNRIEEESFNSGSALGNEDDFGYALGKANVEELREEFEDLLRTL
jgi:hypothetical protein